MTRLQMATLGGLNSPHSALARNQNEWQADGCSPAVSSSPLLALSKGAIEELDRRRQEGLSVYQPLPNALAFHQSDASERIVIGSNRSGKTQAAVVEFAWAVTGTHPWLDYPKKNGRFYAVGFDFDHIREVMWKKLAREGSVKVLRDEFPPHKWRSVLPDQPYDAANREKWRDAGPILPPRFIKPGGISWNVKNQDIPEVVRLVNGTVINWYSSRGAPQQGSSIDGWWFDEEIENARWLPEMEARTVDRGGRGFWSCTPERSTRQLYEMYIRATDKTVPWDIKAFVLTIADNPYLSEAKKNRFRRQLRTQHEIDTKYYGKFALAGSLVYPEYSRERHIIKNREIPADWSRHMIVDPGVQVCAVLFAAVPPPGSEQGAKRHIYDELYLQRCSARIFAEQVERKMGFLKNGGFETFVIDRRMGRQTQIASGTTVEEAYSEALADKGIWSQSTRSGFYPGNDNIAGREESLRKWLETSVVTGEPTLQIHERCVSLDWEMAQQFYKRDPKGPPTDKREDKNNHAVSCAEYFADFDPRWVKPTKPRAENPILKHVKALKSKKFGKTKAISLGPTGIAAPR